MTEPTSIIGPAILEIDQAIAKTQISQKELGKELDRLVEKLSQFSGIAQSPALLDCVEKLEIVKKRLNTSEVTMKQVCERVTRIEQKLSTS